ncbi:MAG TPA: cell wall hydrolase [Xanthomonadales bacterium]|nr:cell wall hydrolase [Xanthomonadales bacterium]
MKLAWILWLANILPQPVADPLCLTATIYLEARDQSEAGQRAVAEVALRRTESGLWGTTVCETVLAHKQFAPTIIHPGHRLKNADAWRTAAKIAFASQYEWRLPAAQRREIVPGASHFAAHDLVDPAWANQPVAVIGDHSFYRVIRLAP